MLLRFLCSFRRGLVGPRRRVLIMKHSHIVRVTRLSHPKEFDFAFSFGFRLSHPKAFEVSSAFGFRLSHPNEVDFDFEFVSSGMVIAQITIWKLTGSMQAINSPQANSCPYGERSTRSVT